MMRDLYERLALLDRQIARYDDLIQKVYKALPASQRLEKIRGVGPMIATAVIAAAGSASEFSNGRQFAAWPGLTPRQHLSGGKDRLFGITKRSNGYLRMLLVHGARSVVQQAVKHTDRLLPSSQSGIEVAPASWQVNILNICLHRVELLPPSMS